MNGLSLSLGLGLGGGGSVWSPANLGASPYAFWDAERAAKLSLTGALVDNWTDAASNAYVAAGTSTFRPTYSATSWNGRPGIAFTKASTTNLGVTGANAFPVDDDPFDVWALVDQTLAATDTVLGAIFDYGANFNTGRRVERVVVSGVNRAQMRAGTGAATSTATNGSADFSGPTLVRARFGATASRIDVDGVAGASASITPATSTGNIKIGCSLSGGSAFEGVVNAIIVTPPLSGADETNMYAWANARLA